MKWFTLFTVLLAQIVMFSESGFISGLIEKGLQKTVKLVDGGYIYNFWKEADVPIYMLVRFFNVTNPNRVLRGEKPILEEVGPYVYQEKRENFVEGWGENNETVRYRMKTTYWFRPDFSSGPESDIITTLNVPYIVMMEKTGNMNLSSFGMFLVREIFSNNNERLFVRKTVAELLFQGYYQDSIEAMADLSGDDQLLPNNTFGFFYGKNETTTDLLEIYTGVGNESLFGETKSWEGQTSLNYWNDEYCNMINGSDGAVFPPWIRRNMTLRTFSSDMCRSMYLTYSEDVRVTGLKGYKFVILREVLADPGENPDNACYCRGGDFGPCLKTGAMRLAPCKDGIPVVVSWPHFYNGDEAYLNQSVGLKPEASLHETFVILEPYTGLIRRGSKRYQINMEIKPTSAFRDMKRVKNMVFPVLWVEESKLSRFRTRKYFQKMLKPKCEGGEGEGMMGQMRVEDDNDSGISTEDEEDDPFP